MSNTAAQVFLTMTVVIPGHKPVMVTCPAQVFLTPEPLYDDADTMLDEVLLEWCPEMLEELKDQCRDMLGVA